ncbi:phosphonate ABC transporter, substrate-binding protein [Escherichia coli]|uniref:Phosphonate ABC transporter, substrate-binding protein n=1 Tax=Escherichia coli TaxID=562 RepID=A0A377B7A9_ECOLX|nr:phosphonate ABC transporter, substrate-binding protein [Escherichia coli]
MIWKSPLIPGDPIVWRKNLSETTKDKIYDFFMNYGKTPEEKAVLERLGWAPFRASSDLQLVPIRQLALFKEMQGVKSNKGLNEQDKLAKTTEIQAQLDDLDRLNNALSAMSSVSKSGAVNRRSDKTPRRRIRQCAGVDAGCGASTLSGLQDRSQTCKPSPSPHPSAAGSRF